MTDNHPRDLTYTPTEVARYTLEELQRKKADPKGGIPFGIQDVDAKMNPLRPGELNILIGRPSHYKSGLAQWWARNIALGIEEPGTYVVFGTVEMAIEELGLYDLAVQAKLDAGMLARGELEPGDWEALEAAGMKRAALPLWLLGHSLARRRKRIRMTITAIEQALYWIEDNWQDKNGVGFRAKVVFLDYLNLLKTDRRVQDRRIEISDIVASAKDLALTLGCPVVMLAQAGRQCDERQWKLPVMADCMESAALEQYADRVFSVWMPKVTDLGHDIQRPDGKVYPADVVPNLLVLGMLKQKSGPAGGYFSLYVDPAQNQLRALADDEGLRF